MTQGELEVVAGYWQKVLRHQDWEIKTAKKRQRDIGCNGWATCDVCLPSKAATIEVVDPIDYDDGPWPFDMEHLVVHELLHIHFAPFKTTPGSHEEIFEEQAVESLTRALLSLNRITGEKDGQEELDCGSSWIGQKQAQRQTECACGEGHLCEQTRQGSEVEEPDRG
jgi:hypothetical protein